MKLRLATIAAVALLTGFAASPSVAQTAPTAYSLSIDDLTDQIAITGNVNVPGTFPEISTIEGNARLEGNFIGVHVGFNILDQDGITLSDLLLLQLGINLFRDNPTPDGFTDLHWEFTSDVEGGGALTPFTGDIASTITETGAFQVVYSGTDLLESGNSLNIRFRSDVEVPEPSSLALLGAALFGLGASRRRRRARFPGGSC